MDTSQLERKLQQSDWHVAPPDDLRERCLPSEPITTATKHWRLNPVSGVASGAIAAAVIVGIVLWTNTKPQVAFAAERAFNQAEANLGKAQRLILRQSHSDGSEDPFVIWVDRKLGYRMEFDGDNSVEICDLSGGHLHRINNHPEDGATRVLTYDWNDPDGVNSLLNSIGYDKRLRTARALAKRRGALVQEIPIEAANGAIWRVAVGEEYTVDFDEQLRVVRLQHGPLVETYEYPDTLDASLFAEPGAYIPRVTGLHRELRQCSRNMLELGAPLFIYRNKYGHYPHSLDDPLLASFGAKPRMLQCPGSSLTDDRDYVLLYPESLEPPAEPVVECRAHGDVRVVGFTDGHVEIIPLDEH